MYIENYNRASQNNMWNFFVAVATIVEVQMHAMSSSTAGAGDESGTDETEALLLSRGLELGSPPTVHAVLDGMPLLRWVYF